MQQAPSTETTKRVTQVKAGPIWNNADAAKKCPEVCPSPSKWNGAWRTTIKGKQSTCDCEPP